MNEPSARPPTPTRRAALRGLGTSLALPWLASWAPGLTVRARRDALRAHAGPPPTRMAYLFFPNGVLDRDWTPSGTGPGYDLPRSLEPLATMRDRVFVLRGLRNVNSFAGEGHYVKTTALLSGAPVRRTGGRDLRCGTTVDQWAAKRAGHLTRLPSLELGIDPIRNVVDMGYSTVYGGTLSWHSPTQPASKEIRPQLAFDRLFRSHKLGRTPRDRSVLDAVLADGRDLTRRVAATDAAKIEEYLDAVRDLERRVQRFEEHDDSGPLPPRPTDTQRFDERVTCMLDLIALAFQTDTTRIASFMFGNAVSGRDFSFAGVRGGHHHLSHHEKDPEKMAGYATIVRWHVEQYVRLLTRLDAMDEGDGTVLDHAAVVLASGIRDGNKHDPKDLPVLLGGGGGGRLGQGAHLRLGHRPLCDLWRTMLDLFGTPTDQFGDSASHLEEVLA